MKYDPDNLRVEYETQTGRQLTGPEDPHYICFLIGQITALKFALDQDD